MYGNHIYRVDTSGGSAAGSERSRALRFGEPRRKHLAFGIGQTPDDDRKGPLERKEYHSENQERD